jgi:hypothetical protein
MSKIEKIDYPFARAAEASEPDKKRLRSLGRPETAAGPAEPAARPPARFLDQEVASVTVDGRQAEIRPPKWFYARVARGASSAQVMNDMAVRLRRAPSERALRLTRRVLEEVGRRRGGGRLVRRAMTQELVDEFLVQEKEY